MYKNISSFILNLFVVSTLILTGCDKDSDNLNQAISQPAPVAPDATFSGTIGFWDFNQTGENGVSLTVPGRSGDWFINGVGFNYDADGLVVDNQATDPDADKNRVELINANQGGLAQQRYFSGAIRFKAKQDPNKAFAFPLLAFGQNPRFLDLMIWNGKIRMRANNGNVIKDTNIEVKPDVWNVLYYRYEGFLPSSSDNNFYVQLNDGAEVVLDLGTLDINNLAGADDNITLGFSNGVDIFEGNIDWVILGLGRMTPANAQYLVDDFKN